MSMKTSMLFYHAVACGSDHSFFSLPLSLSSFWQKPAELTAPLLTLPPAPALKKPLIRYATSAINIVLVLVSKLLLVLKTYFG